MRPNKDPTASQPPVRPATAAIPVSFKRFRRFSESQFSMEILCDNKKIFSRLDSRNPDWYKDARLIQPSGRCGCKTCDGFSGTPDQKNKS